MDPMQQISSSRWNKSDWSTPPAYLSVLAGLLFFVATLLFLIPLPASAQNSSQGFNVKLAARSFFDGNFKYGDWLPVEINLENFGEALDTSVEATITSLYNGNTLNTTFKKEINLAQRANKHFILYLQPFVQTSNVSRSVSYEAQVQLKANGRKLVEKTVKLQPINPQDYLVGTLVSDPNSLASLNNVKVGPLRSRVTAIPMTLADIPDKPEGLRSLNAIILGDTPTDSLSGLQRLALKNWVSMGGELLLMGGPGWSKVKEAFDPTFLPFDVLDFANTSDISGLHPIPGEKGILSKPVALARGQVLQGATPLAFTSTSGTSTQYPLVIERKIGSGRIVATAVDLVSPVLLDWNGSNRVWQDLFNFNAGVYNSLYSEQNPHLKNAGDLLGFISSVPDLSLPNLLPFLGILGIYILVISPLNYLILKRSQKQEFAWVSIPLSILVATGITIYLTHSEIPGQVIVNQMSVIQVGPAQENSQVRTYAAVFSSEDRQYQVSLQAQEGMGSPLMTPLNRVGTNSTPESETPRLVVQGDGARMDGLAIGQWAAQGLSAETLLPVRNFQISSSLFFKRVPDQPEIAKIVGTIRNNTGSTIRNALLVLGDNPTKLKDIIEPGETVNVDYSLPSPTLSVPAYCSTSYSNSGSFPPQTVGDKISNLLTQDLTIRREDRLLSNRAGFLKKMFDSGRYSPLDSSRGLDLIGWLDQNPLPFDVRGVTIESKSNQVLAARLAVSSETRDGENKLFIPSMYLWPENNVNETGLSPLSSRTDRMDEVCVTKGNVVSTFRLPIDQGPFRVKRLTLYLNSVTSNSQRSPTLPDRTEIFDWQSGKWEVISGLVNSAIQVPNGSSTPPSPKPNEITDPLRFVDLQTGRLLIRFSVDSNTTNLLTQFNFFFEGSH